MALYSDDQNGQDEAFNDKYLDFKGKCLKINFKLNKFASADFFIYIR